MAKIARVFLTIGIALLSACAALPRQTRYITSVNALAAPEAAVKVHYTVLPADSAVSVGDLQFREFAGYVERALDRRGFAKAAKAAEAEVVIFLAYAIGDPKTHRFTYTMPTWGQTGVAIATTQGTVSTFGNTANYSGTTTYTPAFGMNGYTTQQGSYTTSTRTVMLHAYDVAAYQKDKTMSELWTTSVVSTGSSNDLRRVFPYMVAAMLPYIGRNSGQSVGVVVPEDSPLVSSLRSGSTP